MNRLPSVSELAEVLHDLGYWHSCPERTRAKCIRRFVVTAEQILERLRQMEPAA